MIRENQKYLNRLQVILDLVLVIISYGVAFYIRFCLLESGNISLTPREYALPVMISIPFYYMFYHMFDIYSARRTKPLHTEVIAILKTNVIVTLLLMVGLFIFKLTNFSRLTLVFFFFINTTVTVSSRVGIRYMLRKYRKLGYNLKHCLIVGTTPMSRDFITKVMTHTHWGYHVAGVVASDGYNEDTFVHANVVGDLRDLDDFEMLLNKKAIDFVVIGIANADLDKLGKVLMLCEKSGVKTNIIPYYYKYIPAKPYMDDLDGLPMIDVRHVPLDNVFKNMGKRVFDIIFSLIAIVMISPVLIFAGVMTKLTSPGPMIYKQERVGINKKNFYMYKFRSMRVQTTDEEKNKWTTKHDPRKTWWGSFMRKTSIDELPQFFNVLKGDMSVVGPRPERPFFVDKFKEDIPRYMVKHQVRPGITGWAQVSGYRGDTSIEKRIEHDLYYIENWTFSFDLRIILQTVLKGFINKNAY